MVPLGQTPHGISVTGSAPIAVEEYNPGTREDSYNNYDSDPFQMAINQCGISEKEVTFCTPGINGLYGFAINYCNIVYEIDSTGNMPNDMMWSKFKWYGKLANIKSCYTPGIDYKFMDKINHMTFCNQTN